MNIPLDRLYHYIENVACQIRGDRVLIYRFWPHGSKKISDLSLLGDFNNTFENATSPEIYCNDQEPLDWELYENSKQDVNIETKMNQLLSLCYKMLKDQNLTWETNNFRRGELSIWDKALLLHSEKNSKDVELYRKSDFIPVYYWTHALLARDWFRYAEHETIKKTQTKKNFLIYNRAWCGTREYRLKFTDLLIENNLIPCCRTWFNPIDPEIKIYYKKYSLNDPQWTPNNTLENFFEHTTANSRSSADFDIDDYNSTEFEVVLETLFATEKIHLTEKILRPIALGQPFILAGPPGSLKYLKDYGFKTFEGIIDESYDHVTDHQQRLTSVIATMKQVTSWNDQQRNDNMKQIKEITDYNRNYFFSKKFFDLILNELKTNLFCGLQELEETNTGQKYLDYRNRVHSNSTIKNLLSSVRDENESLKIFKQAEYYYLRNVKQKL